MLKAACPEDPTDPWRSPAAWLLGFVPTLYLALSGGGYDVIVRSEIGLVACWAVLLGALVGLLPRAGLTRAAWVAVALLGGFLAWTLIAVAWSSSVERTLLEVARVATYLGVFVLALCIARGGTARALLNGVASAIGVVAGLAVLHQLVPSLFPADNGARFYYVARLIWPFEYPDAVGEFVALGLPLLGVVAVAGRTPLGRAAAAAGFVLVVVCLGLTDSHGGILAAVVGLVVLGLLWPWDSRFSATARRAATLSLGAAVAAAIVLFVVTGAAQHAWNAFKDPHMHGGLSGSHRYQYWRAAVHAFDSQPWHGIGPGTFQFYWAQHNSLNEFVLDAHSLYFETLAELGIVGLVLIVCLFVTVLVAGIRRALRVTGRERLTCAAAVAGFAAFCAAASFDWVWQIGVIPMVAMVLAAVALHAEDGRSRSTAGRSFRVTRAILALGSIAALVAIVVPLSETVAVRKSQAASAAGDYRAALSDAATAQRLESGAAGPRLQRALILEQLDEPTLALSAAAQAQTREETNWRISLLESRLAAEADRPGEAVRDYVRARALNPTSPLFTATARLTPIAGASLAVLVIPPGKAGANQYVETIPGVAGNFYPPQPGRTTTALDAAALSGLGDGRTGALALARRGADGLAAARLATDTAWKSTQSGVASRPTGTTASGSTPVAAIATTLAGSDEGGLGAWLPVFLAAVLVGAVWAGLRRTRS